MRAYEFSIPLETKFAVDTGELSGYGSTFGNVDLGGDVCAKSLSEHKSAGTMPAMLWGHDIAEPVGVWTSASEDSKGLLLKGKLTVGTQRGAEARALARDGALALSIGYQTRDSEWQNGQRVLKDLALHEVSLVSIPMNNQARLISVKSATAAEDIRDAIAFELFLKANGFSNRLARRLASSWNDAVKRQGDDDAQAKIAAALQESVARFQQLRT